MRIDRRLLTLAFGGLFWRTFLLIALLIAVSLAAWFQSFRVIEREPRAQRVALQLVAIVKLTRTALLYSDPDLRRALLQDLESNEGVRVYPRETTDKYKLQPDESLNRLIEHDIRGRLGNDRASTTSRASGSASRSTTTITGWRSIAINWTTQRACNGLAGACSRWRYPCSARPSSRVS
jgi:hypothetical protein